MGESPLEPAPPPETLPSLTSAAERDLWRDAPGVSVTVCEGVGHDLPERARPTIVRVLREVLASLG